MRRHLSSNDLRTILDQVQRYITNKDLNRGKPSNSQMRLVQVTPGAGRMYCGNCLRDSALVAAWRRLGHDVLMVPVYLPLTLDEPAPHADTPIFFSGVTVYLDQTWPWFRKLSPSVRRWFSSPAILRLASRFAARTRPNQVADLTLSMLRGEEGNQARDLEDFVSFLRGNDRPDVVCISTALLIGVVRRIKQELGSKIACFLGGEDTFVDAMPEPWRGQIWDALKDRGREIDLFVAPSRFYAEYMQERMKIPPSRMCVIPPGVDFSGYPGEWELPRRHRTSQFPVLGFFARMCREKGLDKLVEAYVALKQSGLHPDLKLVIGGSLAQPDHKFVNALQKMLGSYDLLDDVEFRPNVDRKTKIKLLQSMTVFSVPASYREAFGVYLLEAMGAGVPVVQPPTNAFPEIIGATGGGVLAERDDPYSLAEGIQNLLSDDERRLELATRGYHSVREKFGANVVAQRYIDVFSAI